MTQTQILMYLLIQLGLTIGALHLITDSLPRCLGQKAKWYLLHCIVNAIVTLWTASSMLHILLYPLAKDPYICFLPVFPSILVMSLHVYHALAFHLNRYDIIHHVVMMLILLIPLFNTHNAGFIYFCNYSLFYLCGLPGGVDYYMMYKVECGQMEKLHEKYYNSHINAWVRSVGILYGAFVCYLKWHLRQVSAVYAVPVIAAFLWNAQFYNRLVSWSYGYHQAKAELCD